ncbi:MAG TPA: diaminopimelate epimerase [Acidimicrobiales bacterium]
MRLTKHHGLGNDFLVLLDRKGDHPIDPALARALCDRHRGVGADGLLRASRPAADGGWAGAGGERRGDPPDAVMELLNADGSRAEMSGNGIRCLVQALVLDGWVDAKPDGATQVAVATDAGLRTVVVEKALNPCTHLLTVDMGPIRFDPDGVDWSGGPFVRSTWVDIGNPHLVVEVDEGEDLDAVELVALGERVNAATPGGANVHVLRPGRSKDRVTIRTYERGVGPTAACGTGACASAAVAHRWGLVGQRVAVDQPGGSVTVGLGSTVQLTGPATVIAALEYPYTGPGAGHADGPSGG